MRVPGQTPDLEQLAASQLAAWLTGVPVGSALDIDSAHDLQDTLELLIPQILRRKHHEWQVESIDGFFFSSAVKTDNESVALVGTCILISDQAVTPFALDISLSPSSTIRYLRIRLGEPGKGALGISGPECNSRAAREMLAALNARLDRVHWMYDVTMPESDR
jgi:hypothetical protein